MTLVRKGLISTRTWQATYTASLAVAVFAVSARDFAWIGAVNVCFPLGRMWLGAPKYPVWALLFAMRLVPWPEYVGLSALAAWYDSHAVVFRVGYLLCVAFVMLYGLFSTKKKNDLVRR